LIVANITHGDDVDGLTCAAFLRRVFSAKVFLTNYDDLEHALGEINPEYNSLYITDLNLREVLIPQIKRITGFASVTIIDHHPMNPVLYSLLVDLGVDIVHETRDCAAVLVYDHFKDKLEKDAQRIAIYAAVTDMFEDGPIASRLMNGIDRKFAQHEALILSHALANNQSKSFKERLVEELNKYTYPHKINGAVELAINQLEKIVNMKEIVKKRAFNIGRFAYMECDDENSTGEVANIVMDTLLVPVGMCWKDQGKMINISLRGERGLEENLGELLASLAQKHGGFGGGHKRASGAKIPKDKFEGFLKDITMVLNN